MVNTTVTLHEYVSAVLKNLAQATADKAASAESVPVLFEVYVTALKNNSAVDIGVVQTTFPAKAHQVKEPHQGMHKLRFTIPLLLGKTKFQENEPPVFRWTRPDEK